MTLNANKSDVYQIRKNQPIAIMSFLEARAGTGGSGALVADSIILELQKRGYRIIEREQIDKIRKEQLQIKEGESALSDLEIAKRISQMVAADFFLIGAVTEYASDGREIPLSKVVVKSDAERYERELAEYSRRINTSYAEECEKHEKALAERQGVGQHCAPSVKAKTLDDWQEEFFKQSRKVYSTVARVGVTAKLVDVSTTKIIWVGQANISDTNLQRGMTRIVSRMVDDFISPPNQANK
ncbi:MAG: FlgO family outer membrane protein [Pseudomonadota bacterium]